MEQIRELVAEAVSREMEEVRKEMSLLKVESENLKKENAELRMAVEKLENYVEEVEQYSRKSSLILSGEGVPEPKKDETTEETRELTLQVIKEKLKVDIKGGVVACHRLRNKKRVIIKFQDMEDRNNVYQAKFNTESGVIVHENLTDKRARQVKVLADMKRNNDHVVNYHTKNGIILARDAKDKRYARINPSFNRDQIIKAMQDAETLSYTGRRHDASQEQGRFLISQTFERIPAGHVLNRAESLQSLTVESGKRAGPKTRQAAAPKK